MIFVIISHYHLNNTIDYVLEKHYVKLLIQWSVTLVLKMVLNRLFINKSELLKSKINVKYQFNKRNSNNMIFVMIILFHLLYTKNSVLAKLSAKLLRNWLIILPNDKEPNQQSTNSKMIKLIINVDIV